MKRSPLTLMAILALAAPATSLAAPATAQKELLSIDMTGQGGAVGTARFALLSPAKSDSGTVAYRFSFGAEKRDPNGQLGSSVRGTETLKGKSGQLVIRSSGRTSFTGVYEVWTGTWSIVSGTGKYAGLEGGGGFVTVIISSSLRFSFRYEGFVTRS